MLTQRKIVIQISSDGGEDEKFQRLKKHFVEHGLELVRSSVSKLSNEVNVACGILLSEQSGRIGYIRSCFEKLSDTAEDAGLAFAVLVPTSDQLLIVERVIGELELTSRATVSLTKDAGNAAEYLARWKPGPPFGKPVILPSELKLSERTLLLLQRSFHDCDRIYLETLGGGRDAAGVYCVHAWLKKSIVGPRPLPFFIKFSEPKKIEKERGNYEKYADFYIPFYLRPNVVPARCAQIKGLASIVGNFVEDSVPLRAALRVSQSPGIIFSLFEISLRGFRSQPANEPSETWESPLESFVRTRTKSEKVEEQTISRAKLEGLRGTPSQIETLLCNIIGTRKRRFSPYHGDLHSGNVMVRGKDAILIDFSSVKNGPLTADPAALEVSLVFGTDEDDHLDQIEEWKKAINEIYSGIPIQEPPSLGTRPGPFAWLYRAVREIRHVLLGCDCEHQESTEMIAAYLLRFARLPRDEFKNEKLSELASFRQAYALIIAEKIVNGLQRRSKLD